MQEIQTKETVRLLEDIERPKSDMNLNAMLWLKELHRAGQEALDIVDVEEFLLDQIGDQVEGIDLEIITRELQTHMYNHSWENINMLEETIQYRENRGPLEENEIQRKLNATFQAMFAGQS